MAVDDVGGAPGERQRQLFVDLDVDRHVVGKADLGRELLGEPRDHACVVLDERELLGRDLDALPPLRSAPLGGGRGFRLRLGLERHLGELVDLVVGEAGQLAELAGELDRVLVGLAAEAAEAEELVDRALELERLLAPLRVVRR